MASVDTERLLREITAAERAANKAADEGREGGYQSIENPYEPRRWVSSLSTLQQIAPDDPGRPYLGAWVLWLLLGRVCHEADEAERRARHERSVQIGGATPREASPREALRELLGAKAAAEREEIARGLAEASGPGDAAAELWMRRGEALRRAGGAALEPLLTPAPSLASLGRWADRALADTDAAAREVLPPRASWAEALARGLGQGDGVPWPTRLTRRWALAPFEGEAGWLDVPALRYEPGLAVVGGASAARALYRLGLRWADAAGSRTLPAPLARLPSGLARHQTGALLASLLSARPFLTRALGLSEAEAERARRQQGRVALLSLRVEAARVLAALAALRGDRDAAREEASARMRQALGEPPPGALSLALPRLRPTAPARLLAFSCAAAEADALRDVHDEDWYRNRRAVLALRDRLDRAPRPNLTDDEIEAGHVRLLRRIEEALR